MIFLVPGLALIGQSNAGVGSLVLNMNHSLGSKDLDALIVAVGSKSAQVDDSKSSGGKLQDNDDGVVVVHGLDLGDESLGGDIDLDRELASDPGHDVDVVDRAVVEDATGAAQEGDLRKGRVSAGRLDNLNMADFA